MLRRYHHLFILRLHSNLQIVVVVVAPVVVVVVAVVVVVRAKRLKRNDISPFLDFLLRWRVEVRWARSFETWRISIRIMNFSKQVKPVNENTILSTFLFRMRASLKPICHIRFPHTFYALRCVFEAITFFHRHQQTKTQHSAVNACVNGMCKRALRYKDQIRNQNLFCNPS